MISVDTNIIISALNRHDANHNAARTLLTSAAEPLLLSPVVHAELVAAPDRRGISVFLERASIRVLWDLPGKVWERAGRAFGEYATLRRDGVLPRRIVADFVIAAHAEYHQLAVLTFDDTVYKAVFPKLRLVGGA